MTADPAKPLTLAIDLGGSHVSLALVSDNRIEDERSFSVDPTKGLQTLMPSIAESIRDLFAASPGSKQECTGIGMALPVLVDRKAARATTTPKGKFEDAIDIDFRSWAKQQFGLPLMLEGDAHAGCIGEWIYGAGKGCEDLVFVTLGSGYGSSVILRGKCLRGRGSQAGNLGGHFTVNAGGHPCICPNQGCVEAETGTWALDPILREQPGFAESSLAAYETVNYRILIEEWDAGDSLAKRMFERSLSYWGASLVNLTHAYNPEKIIMAGCIMRSDDRIIPFMNQYVRKHSWTATDYPQIMVAKHRESSALFGCRGLFTQSLQYL